MLKEKIQATLEAIHTLKTTETDSEVFAVLTKISQLFDIPHLFLGIFLHNKEIHDSFLLYSTCSATWQEYYLTNRCYLYDPIFQGIGQVGLPFEWDPDSAQATLFLQQKLMQGAYQHGLTKGTTIPLWPHSAFQGFLTIFNQVLLHPEVLQALFLAANACTEVIVKKKEQKALNTLTPREKEILAEKSRGLSIKKVSRNMKISETTVAFHLANIRQKLDVSTTEYAVLKFLTYSS